MIEFPLKVPTRVTAMCEAKAISEATDETIYLFHVSDGWYVIDNQPNSYSNENLILKLKRGEKLWG